MSRQAFVREVNRIEFTNKWLWRWLRPVVGGQLARRCRHCVIPESYRAIGADGLCDACRQPVAEAAVPQPAADSGQFDQLLQSFAGRGPGQHDALVLISGGKDSSLLLHRLRSDYPGLRLISLLVDNGFMSPIALDNAARVRSRFDVDHLTYRLNAGFVAKGFRFVLTHLERQRGYSMVDMLDGTLTFDTARTLASQMRLPLIICGLSAVQSETLFAARLQELPPGEEVRAFERLAQTPLPEIYDEDEMERFWDPANYPASEPPRFMMPMVVWDLDETHILAEVERLGLLQADRTRPLLTNNALIPLIAIAEISQFGYTSFEVEFAEMIRRGKSDRTYWRNLFEMAEYSAKTGSFLSASTLETLSALGLTKADVGLKN